MNCRDGRRVPLGGRYVHRLVPVPVRQREVRAAREDAEHRGVAVHRGGVRLENHTLNNGDIKSYKLFNNQ